MTLAKFRLHFDVPHSFAIEPGFVRTPHCHDFRPGPGALAGTYQDPNTGAIMLQPSFLTAKFYGASLWHPLTDWLYDPDFWEKVYRGGDPDSPDSTARFFTTTPKDSSHSTLLPQFTDIGIVSISTGAANASDVIAWTMRSNWGTGGNPSLAADEGFVWEYHILADELHRHVNWFALQWANIALLFTFDGTCRAYLYGSDLSVAPTQIDEFQICSPGDITNRHGYFAFVPIPGLGLSITHSLSAQKLNNKVSSATAGVTRGHLVKLPYTTVGGEPVMLVASELTTGTGIRLDGKNYVFGYHAIRYDTGTHTTPAAYLDNIFDPGYKPSTSPSAIAGISTTTALRTTTTLTAALRKIDDSGAWTPNAAINAGDRQGRIKASLGTSDARYTPFLLGAGVGWNPVFDTRDTTSTAPDKVYSLEFTEDDEGHVEGVARCLHWTPANRVIAERGDTTWLIEKSLDGGTVWTVVGGGIAQLDGPLQALMDSSGRLFYEGHWRLNDMRFRFGEVHLTRQNALDHLNLGDAITTILLSSGFPALHGSVPAGLTGVSLPATPEGQAWRYGPRESDGGDVIIKDLLLLGKKQFVEYRIRYDWANHAYVAEQKPHDTSAGNTWTFTPFEDELPATRWALYTAQDGPLAFTVQIDPPEANVIWPWGMSQPDTAGSRVPGTPLYNVPSLSDSSSVDYLGRMKTAYPMFAPLSDVAQINQMGRRVYDAAAHRRLRPSLQGRTYIDALKPGAYVTMRAATIQEDDSLLRGALFTGLWLRRRTVSIDYNGGAGEDAPDNHVRTR
jgi:hypothetical protein